MVLLYPLNIKSTEEVWESVRTLGIAIPSSLICDNGRKFTFVTFKDLCSKHRTRMAYNRCPTPKELNDSRRDTIGGLTSDLSLVWGRANLVLFNASKTLFLLLSTRDNVPDNYPLFFNDTQLPLSSTLNTFGLSFTKYLKWQFHISTLAKSASKKLCVLWRLRPHFSLSQLLALYWALSVLVWSMALISGRAQLIQLF